MAGRKRLQKLYLGKEATPGTAVAATAQLRVKAGMLEDKRIVKFIDEDVGIFNGTDRSAITKIIGNLSIPSSAMTFEQIQYFLAAAFNGPTTGSADGSGSDKVYTTPIPTTSTPATSSYTIQGGDDFEVEQLNNCLVTKIEISGVAGDSAMVAVDWVGQQVSRLAGGFAAGVALPAVEDVLQSKSKLYLDVISGAYGTTVLSQMIVGVKITYTIKWQPVFTDDGVLTPTYFMYVDHNVKGEVTFLHDTAVSGNAGAKADFRSKTPKLLRVDYLGSALTTNGTTYQQKHFIMDLPIIWSTVAPIGEQDGYDIVKMTFESNYDATAGNAGKFIVVLDGVASLP